MASNSRFLHVVEVADDLLKFAIMVRIILFRISE